MLLLHLRAAGGFAGGLHRGQEQRHQHADDGDHHQQFHQGEAAANGEWMGKHGRSFCMKPGRNVAPQRIAVMIADESFGTN